jgi:hypothetical protein
MTIPALEELESRVAQAAELVAALRERNRELESRVRELERGAGSAPPAREPVAAERDGGLREREELRRRVAGLAERLESLLEE